MFVPLSFWRLSERVKIIPPFTLAYYLSAGVFKPNNGISQMPMPAAFYFNSAIGDTQVNRIGWGEGKKHLLAAVASIYNHMHGHWQGIAVGSATSFRLLPKKHPG